MKYNVMINSAQYMLINTAFYASLKQKLRKISCVFKTSTLKHEPHHTIMVATISAGSFWIMALSCSVVITCVKCVM